MAHDEALAARIRAFLSDTPRLTERKMFGGIGWMIGGHMAAGAHNDGRLMIRCAKADWTHWVEDPGAAPMVQRGRAMSGWILVQASSVALEDDLASWLERGRNYAAGLPPKG